MLYEVSILLSGEQGIYMWASLLMVKNAVFQHCKQMSIA